MEPKQRPTEYVAAVAGALAAIIVYAAGIDDPGIMAAIAVVLGAVPGVVTWAVVTFRRRQG